ncbi:zinc-binding dehydrogenase [Enterococcus gilvus]|uniref:zinc-dependent alcohol dehydrogenase n=1 Tax=Enterococcus gilvus TaxID=160453 RepID=UPI001C8CEF50|nr:zinc-binding dehydrogenase [Enterococcus gilvus]MBX8939062.1 zinc-binding dehydrogenase [Enterococcus gilvus]
MIPDKIKFGCLVEKGVAKVKEMPMPELLADEILVKQDACNICTTDYQQWLGLREHQGYPMAGGHECSGTIIAKGSAVGDTYDIGDRVSVVYDYCGYCNECKHGEVTGCENIKQFGKNYSEDYYGIFGFANYFVRKAKSFVKMNPDLSPSEAAFVEPLSSVIQNMKKLRVKAGTDTVVVIGGGTMGLLNAETARAFGAKVIVSELMEKKVEVAKSMGFEVINPKKEDPVQKVKELTNGKGADIVIVAVGATPANNQALEMVKPKDGKISMYAAGYPAPEMDVDPNKVHYMRLELIGTYGSTLEDFSDAAEMLNTGRVDVSKLVETQIPLEDIQKAFETASTPGNYRVSVILD